MTRPLILITNDDGITSKGIRSLIEIAQEVGEVFVVAPDQPQSGKSHAITLEMPIHTTLVGKDKGLTIYSCNGTPVDCVKLGINELMDRAPDLVLSGINHGSNSSVNVIYSGTMAGAIEGFMHGVPSIGFSLLDHSANADFDSCKKYIINLISFVLDKKQVLCLNVNIPKLGSDEIKGYKFCKQAKANWKESFDFRIDPLGRNYYWMTGVFVNDDTDQDTDEWALNNGYISIVPVQYDFTAYQTLQNIKNWQL
jgi:5'-nucleotidase